MASPNLTMNRIDALEPAAKPYDVPDGELPGLLVRVQPKGDKVFYWRYRRRTNRRQQMVRIESWKRLNLADARRIARGYAAEIARGGDPVTRLREEREAAKRAEQEAKLAAERKHNGRFETYLTGAYATLAETEQKRGAENVERVKAAFRGFLDDDISAITAQRVKGWRADRVKAGIAKTTIDREVSALSTVLARATEAGLTASNPLAGLKPLVKASAKLNRVRFLSANEETRLRAALRDRDSAMRAKRARMNAWLKARGREALPALPEHFADHIEPMVLVLLGTGLRFGELTSLRWSATDFRTRMLTVAGETAKGGVTRHVPLSREVMSVLSRWRAQAPSGGPRSLVFPGKDGEPLVDIKTAWAAVLGQAKVEQFRIHDLRHTYASKLVQRGVSLFTVQKLLGHASPTMTMRYSHLAPDHLADAVAVLDQEEQPRQVGAA